MADMPALIEFWVRKLTNPLLDRPWIVGTDTVVWCACHSEDHAKTIKAALDAMHEMVAFSITPDDIAKMVKERVKQ